MYLLLAAAIAALPRLMFRFGGEDPIKGSPWYHEKLTREAAIAAGFDGGLPSKAAPDSGAPANGLAWAADYVDSYLYNPLWQAAGGPSRYKAALLAHDDLIKVHFDDLTSTAQIEWAWRRYLGGTVAGLLWAADRDDVAAARHVVGVGLHALQDFYAHSNWVDQPKLRTRTWTSVPAQDRAGLNLYTGTYEHEEPFGLKPHGKLSLDCTIMQELVGATAMNVICDPVSPMSDSSLCRRWRECQTNSAPTAPTSVLGVPVPRNVVWLQPPGIALDSTWLARINGRNRDVPGSPDPDTIGAELFGTALELARTHSRDWLEELGTIMAGQGLTAFWDRVRRDVRTGKVGRPSPVDSDALLSYEDDVKQFEQPNKLPLTFLSAGAYPPSATGADEGWFVRLELHTADDEFDAGTNADIDVVMSDRTFRLDHGADLNRLLEFNDFEKGDQTFYVVGPFDRLPTTMTLRNHGGGVLDILSGAWEDLKTIVGSLLEFVGDFLLSLIGGDAEYSGSDKLTWTWPELVAIAESGGEDIEFHCAVEGEGDYRITGRLTATAQPDGSLEAVVQLRTLHCIQESTIDQGSSDDEPFVLLMVNSPGADLLTKGRSKKFKGVDSGESRDLEMPPFPIRVPRHGGLIVPVQVWESDDEGPDRRDEILENFADKYLDDTAGFRSQFLDAIGEAVLADWKLHRFEAYAHRRGYLTRTAYLARGQVEDRWIGSGESETFDFDPEPVVRSVVVPALLPPVETTTLLAGGSVPGLAVSAGTVLAAVSPAQPVGGPLLPGRLHRLGQHLENGTSLAPGGTPRSVAVRTGSNRLYVIGSDGKVALHDATSLAKLGSAPIGFGAYDVAVSEGTGLVWVSRWQVTGGEVHVFTTDLAPVGVFTTPDGFHGTTGLAAHPTEMRALVARGFRSGGEAGPLVTGWAELEVRPDGTLGQSAGGSFGDPSIQPVDAAYDVPAGLAFVSCLGTATVAPRLAVLKAAEPQTLLGTVDLPTNAHAVATVPGTGIAYVATDGGLCLVDGESRKVLLTMPLGTQPRSIAVDPATGAAFLGDSRDGTVTRVDVAAILG